MIGRELSFVWTKGLDLRGDVHEVDLCHGASDLLHPALHHLLLWVSARCEYQTSLAGRCRCCESRRFENVITILRVSSRCSWRGHLALDHRFIPNRLRTVPAQNGASRYFLSGEGRTELWDLVLGRTDDVPSVGLRGG